MTRGKVLSLALAIILLGAVQLVNWLGKDGRAAGIGTASGMLALLSGVGMAIYGLTLRNKS